jgi:hypothetical protein
MRGNAMTYIPPFKVIRNRLTVVSVNGKPKVSNSYDEIIDVIKLVLRGTAFDETWYLSRYPDVAAAVNAGSFKSGKHHFIEVGYFEGRRPGDLEIDEAWYLRANPDVSEGIRQGAFKSAREHFKEHGYDEGRTPSEL